MLELFARATCAGVLLVAGASKARDESFAGTVSRLTGLTPRLAGMVGRAVPPLEIGLGVLLLVGPLTRAAAAAAGLLLVIFASILIVNLVRGQNEPCACFGSHNAAPLSWWMVLRNLVLSGFVQPAAWGIPLGGAASLPLPIGVATISGASLVLFLAVLIPYVRTSLSSTGAAPNRRTTARE